MGHLLGYARVSTVDQNPDLQLDALKDAGCYRVFVDQASGALENRPQLHAILDQLRPGDTLAVWKLDRLGRSLRHLIEVVACLDQRGVGFRSLQENLDTTTPGGRLVFHLFGALAEFERDLIRERTTAGLNAARARGRKGGRPSVLPPPKLAVARQMYDSRQHTVSEIAQVLGVSRASIYRHLARDEPPSVRSHRAAPAEAVDRPGFRHGSTELGAPLSLHETQGGSVSAPLAGHGHKERPGVP